ncbi:unnamed protein product [Cuscuta epithymum]|uniref:RING-type domain-containing protein n=1 Tax=Cuscuta epithymum TaxID=186058 RepID=A0AAV0D239_9ASTE|nr:unnamed protein product [Cuscuta epithymum]CAH9147948.1 unnamed protein product [Cuscuta epithymum]
MTSASELFYNRRTRLGRGSSELDSAFDRICLHNQVSSHRHNRRERSSNGTRRAGRLDLVDHDPLPRSRIPLRRSSVQEHVPAGIESLTGLASPGTASTLENEISIHNSFITNRNGGLPGPVLLARERLLQRLRGVSLSGNRCNSNTVSTNSHSRNLTIEDDFRLAGERDQVARTGIATDLIQIGKIKRPPGLTQESMESLRVEIFNLDDSVLPDCSICLETFLDGEELFHLPCGHRFHNGCLIPWVRTCGDCPYCRTGILKRG